MKSFRDKIAAVTGGGTGMGRALAEQLAAEGCHVAMCDVSAENMAETKQLCEAKGTGVRVTTHVCDVSDERQMQSFRDALLEAHRTDHLHLLFNNAGIDMSGALASLSLQDWQRAFGPRDRLPGGWRPPVAK